MSGTEQELTPRERELGAIIGAYNDVTERLKQSHEQLRDEVRRLREQVAAKNRQLRRRERLAALGEVVVRELDARDMPAAFALRLVFGEMSGILLEGSRASNVRLLEAGMHFSSGSLSKALADTLGHRRAVA